MNIKEKLACARESASLTDMFSAEERMAAKLVGLIAASIQLQRKAKGYTQQNLADMLGVSQVMISRWENGEENFTVTTLAKISAALEMELSNPLKPAA